MRDGELPWRSHLYADKRDLTPKPPPVGPGVPITREATERFLHQLHPLPLMAERAPPPMHPFVRHG
jgi:hypothetical protein